MADIHKIREKFESKKDESKSRWCSVLREKVSKYADWTDDDILNAHVGHVSLFQSNQSKGGSFLETSTEEYLQENKIPFVRQVSIDRSGIIIKRDSENTVAILDIVIGSPKLGDSIRDFIVLSSKTSSRERAKQDEWTKIIKPKLFIYFTASKDYPSPAKFNESDIRKIITDTPKKKDTRKFKLGFCDLISTIEEIGW